MNDELRSQIYSSMNHKSTAELVELWTTNDRVEWSDTAFEVMKEILKQRLVDVPAQNEPILKHISQEQSKFFYGNIPVDMINDVRNEPIFYQPKKVLWNTYWLDKVAIIYIPISILSNATYLNWFHSVILSFFGDKLEMNAIAWLVSTVLWLLVVGLQCLIYYFSLRGLAYVLKVLMAIEYNSREAQEKIGEAESRL